MPVVEPHRLNGEAHRGSHLHIGLSEAAGPNHEYLGWINTSFDDNSLGGVETGELPGALVSDLSVVGIEPAVIGIGDSLGDLVGKDVYHA